MLPLDFCDTNTPMSTSDASLGCFAGGFCGEIGGEVPGDGEIEVGVA